MKEKTIDVLLVKPGKFPQMVAIENTLEAKQQLVGGWIEAVYPFKENAALVCSEEGKINGLPLNRGLYMDGQMYDIVAGNFFICGLSEDDFTSLSPAMAKKFEKMYHNPEIFFKTSQGIVSQKIPNEFDVDEPEQSDDDLVR